MNEETSRSALSGKKVAEGGVIEGDWCVVSAWHLYNSLQVYEDMGDCGSLYVEEFGDTRKRERRCDKRKGRNEFGKIGEAFRACEGV